MYYTNVNDFYENFDSFLKHYIFIIPIYISVFNFVELCVFLSR